MHPLRSMLSFTSARQWNQRLEHIPFGIPGEGFQAHRIDVPTGVDSEGPPVVIEIVCRNAADVVRFLLAHQPFKEVMHYRPTKLFRDETSGIRVYNELHTGDWWWATQAKLPPGATVVPILIAVDKTLMTMLHGDMACWPVYLTIGNIERDVRRAHDRCGIILLGFVPIIECGWVSGRDRMKHRLYHSAMSYILRCKLNCSFLYSCPQYVYASTNLSTALETIGQNGEDMLCADGQTRTCYPIMCGIIADYQEQTLITGVKNNQHCTICKVPPRERGELLKGPWAFRTHLDTQAQIQRQRITHVEPSSDDWVHDAPCFAWNHAHFNIHEGMLADILHQLLKGLVMYTVTWIQQLIGQVVPKKRARARAKVAEGAHNGRTLLDQRFRDVPVYTNLRRFAQTDFSKVTQWTGDEQKAVVRQLVAVITPILCEKHPYAVHFTKAVCDFVTIAQYRSHDDDTLAYLDDALKRIDALKHLFQSFRPREKDNPCVGHFNLPKLHGLTHWRHFIKTRGSPDGYDTGPNGEAPHNFLLKVMYKLTNKRDFLLQLGRLNSRMVATLSLEAHMIAEGSSQTSEVTKQMDDVHATTVSGPVQLRSIGWGLGWTFNIRTRRMNANPTLTGTWVPIREAARLSGISNLTQVLTTFVRDQADIHTLLNSTSTTNAELGCLMENAVVQVHPSMSCWQREGKHPTNTEFATRQVIRCRPWGSSREWRRDFVIATNFGDRAKPTPHPHDDCQRLHGKTVGRVELIFTVWPGHLLDPLTLLPVTYTGVLLDRIPVMNLGRPHPIHGMIELEYKDTTSFTDARRLSNGRAFNLSMIWRGIHVVPGSAGSSISYINNYIDFELYNELYSPTFEEDGNRIVRQFKQYQKQQRKHVDIHGQGDLAQASARKQTSTARTSVSRGLGIGRVEADNRAERHRMRVLRQPVVRSDDDEE